MTPGGLRPQAPLVKSEEASRPFDRADCWRGPVRFVPYGGRLGRSFLD